MVISVWGTGIIMWYNSFCVIFGSQKLNWKAKWEFVPTIAVWKAYYCAGAQVACWQLHRKCPGNASALYKEAHVSSQILFSEQETRTSI